MTRSTWKRFYRQMRIIRREQSKAFTDAMIFGTGVVYCGPDVPDFIRHVPIEHVVFP